MKEYNATYSLVVEWFERRGVWTSQMVHNPSNPATNHNHTATIDMLVNGRHGSNTLADFGRCHNVDQTTLINAPHY